MKKNEIISLAIILVAILLTIFFSSGSQNASNKMNVNIAKEQKVTQTGDLSQSSVNGNVTIHNHVTGTIVDKDFKYTDISELKDLSFGDVRAKQNEVDIEFFKRIALEYRYLSVSKCTKEELNYFWNRYMKYCMNLAEKSFIENSYSKVDLKCSSEVLYEFKEKCT
ncbi:hypothetical protein [Candidatus Deianiraea vastatrix]|uniref:Uncharacterized protein n=1 Tax=Candidatus Deianiraea vastatrix TaxID=2163644 RepID=A0A5B8XEW6_9RICK|nr:hypothetical protein [Candidatus Deianiraea vastatrix]QED23813.1 hypothetical protein Deia_01031 [Candidatus Deianiraea vastatrix]